jgi:PAS domain S-box-containing protein
VVGRVTEATSEPDSGDRETANALTAVEALPILLVDDIPENRRTLEAVLAPLGIPLRSAASGEDALRMLLEQDFALILLDVRMPGLDGLGTARIIKQRERTRETPIVFMTAARDEVRDIVRGYGVGAVDYVLKPFDAELLRSKVAVFAELEANRRALKRSEALLRGAFEAAPVGKTVLDHNRAIVRANPAFARLVDREPLELQGVALVDLCHPEDRQALEEIFEDVSRRDERTALDAAVDIRLVSRSGSDVWVGMVASAIERIDFADRLLLAQWVDLSVRRRAERARADLLVEQAARAQAEALNERLGKLQELSAAIESLSLEELLGELAIRLTRLMEAEAAEAEVVEGPGAPLRFRARAGHPDAVISDAPLEPAYQEPVRIDRRQIGSLRIGRMAGREPNPAERSLLRDAADRASLGIRRALLHEEEHHTAVALQRGLLPKELPELEGTELAVHYQAAGIGAEVGGDWYDAFVLPGHRLGIVIGDVAGRSIPAASVMGQLRTVARAFALAAGGSQDPGPVLDQLASYRRAAEEREMFTVVYAILDPRGGRVQWANAGHPPPLLRTAGGETRYLDGGGGVMAVDTVTYATFEAPMSAGDTLVLYTDGLVERRQETLDAGLDRLARAVISGPAEPVQLCQHVLSRLLPVERLDDDVTALMARVTSRG